MKNSHGCSKLIPGLCGLVLGISLMSTPVKAAGGVDFFGIGPKVSLIVADNVGAGPGFGAHALIGFGLGKAGRLAIYPNVEFWFASDDEYQYWRDGRWWWYDLNVFEFTFNADVRYYFPVPSSLIVKPYAGLGLAAPAVTTRDYDWNDNVTFNDPFDDDTDIGVAFNMLGGIDLELSDSFSLFFEFKGKFGDWYEVFKMTFGMTFALM